MIKLFFFGTLPLGWKRFFRAISFVWFCYMLFIFIEDLLDFNIDELIYLLFGIGAPLVLSYALSGFFGKKTD